MQTNFLCLFLVLSSVIVVRPGHAAETPPPEAEPAYCDPARFDELEIDPLTGAAIDNTKSQNRKAITESGLIRVHAFRVGKAVLAGLAVGNSPTQAVINMAARFAPESKARGYCTWYLSHPSDEDKASGLNKNRQDAVKFFNHRDLYENPREMTAEAAVSKFGKVLGTSFDQESPSFLSCVEQDGYVAIGCNGMQHRGPTVFGMLLAFSGCSPQHALEIADQYWALNGVKRSVRLSVIRYAYELGRQRAESSQHMRTLLSR